MKKQQPYLLIFMYVNLIEKLVHSVLPDISSQKE